MQAIRFSAFTPAQQARIDALTGGKSLENAVRDTFIPTTQQEDDQFLEVIKETIDFVGPLIKPMTPDEVERELGPELDYVLRGEAEKDLQDALSQAPNAAEKREFLMTAVGGVVTGLTRALQKWPNIPSDKTFDTLETLIANTKKALNF